MPKVLQFYLDDSGIRYPDRARGKRAEHGYDWFALGGILVKSEDEEEARNLHRDFCLRWKIEVPLHSAEIRSKNKQFIWLQGLKCEELRQFHEELYQLMRLAPVLGLACTIDRHGYNKRYFERYQREPWLLCKTAFSVVVERAAKYARSMGYVLRVAPERCNKKEDGLIESYYQSLKKQGMPFDPPQSAKYGPLNAVDFRQILYEFRPKSKSSPMSQFADLCRSLFVADLYGRLSREQSSVQSIDG